MRDNMVPDKTASEQGRKAKSKLAARFRNINVLFIVFILVVVTAVCVTMINSLTDRASRDYVRFYTNEAVDLLSMPMNGEIMLVRHIAGVDEIIEWFADEDDQEKKAAAYISMMHYADMLQISGLYFAIYGSLNEFSIEYSTPFEGFEPMNVLRPDVVYDQWFFDTINADFPFTLNLDVDKVTNTPSIWINYTVFRNRTPVGVICSALQFDDLYERRFGVYEDKGVRGLIIDHNGIVQMDSLVPEPDLLTIDMTEFEVPDKPHILEVIDTDAASISAINRHLENHIPHYAQRLEPDVIKLSGGQFLSIAPIPNTNWLMITFYDSGTLFNITSVLTPIIAIVLAFVVYVLASSAMIQRLVLDPLRRLTGSVSESDHNSNAIYGLSRDDEIGDLARTTKESWDSLGEHKLELNYAHAYAKLMLDATPLACTLWDKDMKIFDCNNKTVELFQLGSKKEYMERFFELSRH
jgi:HAMP domain-containing protein